MLPRKTSRSVGNINIRLPSTISCWATTRPTRYVLLPSLCSRPLPLLSYPTTNSLLISARSSSLEIDPPSITRLYCCIFPRPGLLYRVDIRLGFRSRMVLSPLFLRDIYLLIGHDLCLRHVTHEMGLLPQQVADRCARACLPRLIVIVYGTQGPSYLLARQQANTSRVFFHSTELFKTDARYSIFLKQIL